MQVNKIQSQSFKSFSLTPALMQKIILEPDFTSTYTKIYKNITKNRLDRKRFVDIILDENNDKIVATISSKKQGVPYHPHASLCVKPTRKGLKAFKNWVEEWNHLYNPKTIEKIKKTYELANSGIIARLYPKK